MGEWKLSLEIVLAFGYARGGYDSVAQLNYSTFGVSLFILIAYHGGYIVVDVMIGGFRPR